MRKYKVWMRNLFSHFHYRGINFIEITAVRIITPVMAITEVLNTPVICRTALRFTASTTVGGSEYQEYRTD